MGVNYDPVKAHEYYEKHKKLKGRKKKDPVHSTKGFKKRQKELWAYAKEQLKEEHKINKKNITATSKATRQALSAEAKEKISELREQLKGMPKAQKMAVGNSIRNMIDGIRSQLKLDKSALTETTKGKREEEDKNYQKRRDEAYETIKNAAKHRTAGVSAELKG